jgi:hypothetical protein
MNYAWEDNVIINLTEIGWGCEVDLSGLGYGLVAGSCEHLNGYLRVFSLEIRRLIIGLRFSKRTLFCGRR